MIKIFAESGTYCEAQNNAQEHPEKYSERILRINLSVDSAVCGYRHGECSSCGYRTHNAGPCVRY